MIRLLCTFVFSPAHNILLDRSATVVRLHLPTPCQLGRAVAWPRAPPSLLAFAHEQEQHEYSKSSSSSNVSLFEQLKPLESLLFFFTSRHLASISSHGKHERSHDQASSSERRRAIAATARHVSSLACDYVPRLAL